MEKIEITPELREGRLDKVLSEKFDFTRNQIKNMISKEEILVNDKKTKGGYKLKEKDNLLINLEYSEEVDIEAEDIKLDITYEDNDVIVVNKPSGMVVHPAVGNYTGTLVNALMFHCNNLSDTNGDVRPGIVHRIDKDTSGLLMVAKNNQAHTKLAKQLKEKTSTRKYIAIVKGIIKHDTGTIDAPIGRDINDRKKMAVTEKNSKEAVTHFKVLKRFKGATLIECKLETGRTHQIRVHLKYIGHPILNDSTYGSRKTINDKGQMLHAATLGFIHPTSNEYIEFSAPLPPKMEEVIEMFEEQAL